ncbi:hypothetical protein GCM10020331_029820 [Ectobacillus funiculus]
MEKNPQVYPGDDHERYEDMIDDYDEQAYRGDLSEKQLLSETIGPLFQTI